MFGDLNLYVFIATGAVLGGGTVLFLFVVYSVIQEYRRDRVPALLYHRLISATEWEERPVTGSDRSYVVYDTAFAEQMAYLSREGYTTISLGDFMQHLDGKDSLPAKAILVTFDDGFASNYLYAFPVLKQHGMKATVFMTPDRDSENFKKNAPADFPLTDGQLREMSQNGIAIESHGMTHRYLTELKPDSVRWELSESKRVLQETVGRPVDFLAIPSGAYDRRVKAMARESGYRAVFCMLKGTNNRRSDRFALRRLVIGLDMTLDDFEKILQPATASYLRILSTMQNLLLHLLGPAGLDRLRDFVYGSRFGTSVARGQLKYAAPGIGITLLTLLSAAILVALLRG